MFSQLEAAHPHPTRRWTAIASFTLQAGLVALSLVLPMLKSDSLPDAFAHRPIFRPLSAGVEHVRVSENSQSAGTTIPAVNPIIVARGPSLHPITDVGVGEPISDLPPGLPGFGTDKGVESAISTPIGIVVPHPPAAAHPAPISRMMEGNLIHRVEPSYPVIAKQVGIQGTVLIRALISRSGTIEHAEVQSGPPMLVAAALNAVREWKYKPYYLNGQPVEVETEITVKFILNR